jgi:hypothetical protein
MIMERVQALTRLITRFPRYDFDQEISNQLGIPFPLKVDHAVGPGSDAEAGPVRRPRSLSDGVQGGKRDASSRGAAERPANRARSRPTAVPASRATSPQDRLRSARRAQHSADQELRKTEDALIAFMEQQEKRDRLYVKSREELKERFQFGRMGGVA